MPILFGIDAYNWRPERQRLVMGIFCEVPVRYSVLTRLNDGENPSD
jgi:hypothetical protein